MAKEKKASDPLAPRATKVVKPTTKAKKQKVKMPMVYKSAERITDSDDEEIRDAPAIPTHRAERDTDLSENKSADGAVAKMKHSGKEGDASVAAAKEASKKRIKQLAKRDKSDSSEESSNVEDNDKNVKINARAAPTVSNGVHQTNKQGDSEDGESGSESEIKAIRMPPTNTVTNGHVAADESESESDEEEQEEPGGNSNSNRSLTTLAHSSGISSGLQPSVRPSGRLDNEIDDSQLRPTTKFKAPSGFRPIKDEPISSSTVELFNPENTTSKEIWYISAPASLPITALKEVALDKFSKQLGIMTHDGAEYALVSDPAARDATRVLLPNKIKDGYEVLPTLVDHVLQFQQVLNIQSTANRGVPKSSSQVLPDTTSATKPKKSQPKGLKMRFRPSGFGDGDLGVIGSSDEEDVPAHSTFRQPPTLPNSNSAVKKRKEPNDALVQEITEKKKKKKGKSEDHVVTTEEIAWKNEDYVVEATTTIDANEDIAPPETKALEGKKKKRKDKHGRAMTPDMALGDVPQEVDKLRNDEIAAMKEARKEKKEKKEKKKKDKKRKEATEVVEDVSRHHVPADDGVSRGPDDVMGDKEKKEKKKKKDKKTKQVIEEVEPAGNEAIAEDEAKIAAKNRKKDKKDKKEKKRRKSETDEA